MPFSLNIAGCLFLVLTILKTNKRGTPVWKSSTLALLHHGLEKTRIEPGVLKISQMDRMAVNTFVQLASGVEDGRQIHAQRNDG